MNNNELKAEKIAFFAQYYGQNVAVIPSYPDGDNEIISVVSKIAEIKHLELFSLDSITDDHAIEVAKIYEPYVQLSVDRRNTFSIRINHVDDDGPHQFLTIFFDGEIDNGGNHGSVHNLRAYDKLRELGYLVSFRSLSPAQIIGLGWAKIKER